MFDPEASYVKSHVVVAAKGTVLSMVESTELACTAWKQLTWAFLGPFRLRYALKPNRMFS